MRNLFSHLWNDDNGIVGLEYLILATILGLGLIVGVATVTAALNAEFTELGNAILTLNQSYSFDTQSTCVATKFGGGATDTCDLSQNFGHATAAACDINEVVCP